MNLPKLPDISSNLGNKLKLARLTRGLNLKELSNRSKITEGHLSKIENNRTRPSLGTLHRIAQALGTNLSALFATIEFDSSNVFVVRANQRPKLETGNRRANNSIVLESLVPSGPEYLLQVNIHVIAGAGGSDERISHPGQEFGFVLEGSVDLHVQDEVQHLEEGDSFFFNSELEHCYHNTGEKIARVLWVNTPPTF